MKGSIPLKTFNKEVYKIFTFYSLIYDVKDMMEVIKCTLLLKTPKNKDPYFFKIAVHYIFAQYDFYSELKIKGNTAYPAFDSYINDKSINDGMSSEVNRIYDDLDEFIKTSRLSKNNLIDDDTFDHLIMIYVKHIVFKFDKQVKEDDPFLKALKPVFKNISQIDEGIASWMQIFILDFIIMLHRVDTVLMTVFIYDNYFNYKEKEIQDAADLSLSDVKNSKQRIKKLWLYKSVFSGLKFIPALNENLKSGFLQLINSDDNESEIFKKTVTFLNKIHENKPKKFFTERTSYEILKDFINIFTKKITPVKQSEILSFILYYLFNCDFGSIRRDLPDKNQALEANKIWTDFINFYIIQHGIFFSDEVKADIHQELINEKERGRQYLSFINNIYDFNELNKMYFSNTTFNSAALKQPSMNSFKDNNNKNVAVLNWIPDQDTKNFYKRLPVNSLRQYHYTSTFDFRNYITEIIDKYIINKDCPYPNINSFYYLSSAFLDDTHVENRTNGNPVHITYNSLKQNFNFEDEIIEKEHLKFLEAVEGAIIR